MASVKDNSKEEEEGFTTLPPGQMSSQPMENQDSKASAGTKYYTVERGDTAYSISKQFGISLKQLKDWNQLPASMAVSLGARLQIAP